MRRLPCYEPLFSSWTYLLGLPANALWSNNTQKRFINSPTKKEQHGNCQASCQSLRCLQISFSCVVGILSPARHFSVRTLKRGLPGSGDFPSIKEQGLVWYNLWLPTRWSEFLTFWNCRTQLWEAGPRTLTFYKIILMSQSWFLCSNSILPVTSNQSHYATSTAGARYSFHTPEICLHFSCDFCLPGFLALPLIRKALSANSQILTGLRFDYPSFSVFF